MCNEVKINNTKRRPFRVGVIHSLTFIAENRLWNKLTSWKDFYLCLVNASQ